MSKIRILIADDHAIVRMGLTSLLNANPRFTVIGEAEDGESVVRLARELRPDVIIMDLMMPRKDGATATVEILRESPETKILILTTFGTFNGIAKSLEAGAAGAVLKTMDNEELIAALETVADGGTFVSPEIRQLLIDDPPTPELSSRQLDVLRFLVRGLTNADISNLLAIREDSVKKLVCTIFAKIGAANRAEAVSIVHRKHLLDN